MTQLNDLSDYCLLEVFDRLSPEQLFKIQRVSRRMKQLANEKLRTKVKAITLRPTYYYNDSFASCSHLGSISQNQILCLCAFLDLFVELHDPPKRAVLMNVLSKCSDVKSIDFHCSKLRGDVLLEVFQRCPQLECIRLWNPVEIDDWERSLEQHGSKLVHFVKKWCEPTEARQLAIVAEKCPNIRQVDWTCKNIATRDLIAAFKMLDKSCRTSLNCNNFINNVFEDVFDELDVKLFSWSQFGDRLDRLSILTFQDIHYNMFTPSDSIRGIKFNGLKKLHFSDSLGYSFRYDQQFVNSLVDSQFPLLEEFYFNVLPGLSEDDYNRLFQRMVSVKKLKLNMNFSFLDKGERMPLPGSSIYHLKNLEDIEIKFIKFSKKWQFRGILKTIKQYADGIESLKKMTVNMTSLGQFKQESLLKMIEDKIEQLLKHNRVKVVLLCYTPTESDEELSDE